MTIEQIIQGKYIHLLSGVIYRLVGKANSKHTVEKMIVLECEYNGHKSLWVVREKEFTEQYSRIES
jgi:hypothetical protein